MGISVEDSLYYLVEEGRLAHGGSCYSLGRGSRAICEWRRLAGCDHECVP